MKNKQVYFKTLSEVINELHEQMSKRGETINTDTFTCPSVSYETTERFSLPLSEKNMLHVQIYRMASGSYELNYYTNK